MISQNNPGNNAPSANSPRPVSAIVSAVAVMLVLTWAGAWLLGVGEAGTMAATLVVVVLGVTALGVHHLIPSRQPSRVRAGSLSVGHGSGDNDPVHQEHTMTTPESQRWSLEVFAALDAQRFAAVCETWFSWAGFDTRSEAHRTREGVDIWLHAPKVPGPVAIVRCKHSVDAPVGVQELREFHGLVANCRSAHGTFTTTSTYTPEALQYAQEHGIDAVDGRGLLRKILTRTRQSQQALLAVAFSGQH